MPLGAHDQRAPTRLLVPLYGAGGPEGAGKP
jgi:hypothetical protein